MPYVGVYRLILIYTGKKTNALLTYDEKNQGILETQRTANT